MKSYREFLNESQSFYYEEDFILTVRAFCKDEEWESWSDAFADLVETYIPLQKYTAIKMMEEAREGKILSLEIFEHTDVPSKYSKSKIIEHLTLPGSVLGMYDDEKDYEVYIFSSEPTKEDARKRTEFFRKAVDSGNYGDSEITHENMYDALKHLYPETPEKERLLNKLKTRKTSSKFGLNFVRESSENKDLRVVDFFSTLTRNYETVKPFYTDLTQFSVEEERRDWKDTRSSIELEKMTSHEAFHKIRFKNDGVVSLLEINFSFSVRGTKDKDSPEMEADKDVISVVLEKIDVKKIKIDSGELKYETSSPSEAVKKACEKFLVKSMEVDYDSLGAKIYNIEQS